LVLGPTSAGLPLLGLRLGSAPWALQELDDQADPHLGHPESAVVVVAWGTPEATVGALAREGIGPVHALARWEADLVHALGASAGRPLFGLDLDRAPTELGRLAEFLTERGVDLPGADDTWETAAAAIAIASESESAASAAAPGESPELAALTEAIRARLAPVLAAAAGPHPSWAPPGDLTVGPVSEAVLGAHRAAHRAAVDAEAAWRAVHEAQVAAQDAKAAVEREHRELVGPDPMHYRELRRELWRLRDEFAGIMAGRTNYHVAWKRAEAAHLVAEQRVLELLAKLDQQSHELASIRSHRDEMLASERWRIGGMVLDPLKRFRRPNPER
jgi:hypothetical protein